MNNEVNNVLVEEKKENMLMGIIGALVGSLAGVAVIMLLSKLGFVASVSGAVMSFCTIFMYEKLGHKLSKKGLIICVIVVIAMTYVAHNLTYTLEMYKYLVENGYKPSFTKIFFKFYDAYDLLYEDYSGYIGNLVMLYLFSALGAFGIIKEKIHELK